MVNLTSLAVASSLVISADARNIRHLAAVTGIRSDSAATHDAAVPTAGATQETRGLEQQQTCSSGATPVDAWHPNYAAGWTKGYCRFAKDCNSPAFDTELACCKGAYAGQTSGHCLSQLPNPPTISPTEAGGLNVYYPLYEAAGGWSAGYCTNDRPMPSDRPTYDTMLACCKGAYAGQMSGACLAKLPSPPTTSPTSSSFTAEFWYPDYESSWREAGCLNKLPLPFGPGGRPTFDTQLTCCKGAYAGQTSGKCLSQLPSPPTTSPTTADGGVWYPDYETQWTEAGCTNARPYPFSSGGRPTFDTQLACCKGAYAGQTSGKCLSQLPSPPTTSPTTADGGVWYPEYETQWTEAGCTNARPYPFTAGGRPTFDTQLACCKTAYAGQLSGKCLSQLPSPPTTSPISSSGADVWYPDYGAATYDEGSCINTLPLPFLPGGRPTYDTQLACCEGAYLGQASGKCLNLLASPPTTSPTALALDVFYSSPYQVGTVDVGTCGNYRPLPAGRSTFPTAEACCASQYGSQPSKWCMCNAVGMCHACECHTGSEAQRNTTLAECPNLTCP